MVALMFNQESNGGIRGPHAPYWAVVKECTKTQIIWNTTVPGRAYFVIGY